MIDTHHARYTNPEQRAFIPTYDDAGNTTDDGLFKHTEDLASCESPLEIAVACLP